MKYKSDWLETEDRLSALWEGRSADRPFLAVQAPSGRTIPPSPAPANAEARWLDPEGLVHRARAALENAWWGGESVPSFLLMAGWVVSWGARPRFDERTIWFETREPDFDRPPRFLFDPAEPWTVKHEQAYRRMAEFAGWDDFLVGQPCLLPANDLLSMHMGTERFLTALKDHPAWMKAALAQGAQALVEARRRLAGLIAHCHRYWYGIAGWMPFWAPRPFFSTQSDVSCMLSPDMFDEFVVPELDLYGREFGALWYHLDGGDARHHLPRLLSLPYLRVVQYTPAPCEPPNGPAHLAMYRAIQKAGRIVHIAAPRENVEALVRALDPSQLLVMTHCPSVAEGEELLAASRRWM